MKLHDEMIVTLFVLLFGGVFCLDTHAKHKRQIYREHLLPALGGKIPEEAFRTDRLALNRLNKEGITVIDGVLLEARDHDKNPDSVRSKPETIKVYVGQDSRYVSPEGRHNDQHPKTVDTTYVLRKPVGHDGKNEHRGPNRNGNAPTHQPNRQRNNNKNNNNNPVKTNGCGGSAGHHEAPGPSKAHGFTSFPTFVPYKPSPNDYSTQHRHHYPIIYEPIIAPLVLPARGTYYRKPHPQYFPHHVYDNQAPWDSSYDWNTFYRAHHEPLFLDDDNDFFDSHQIIADYEGFLNTFHGRSYRHVGSPKGFEIRESPSKRDRQSGRPNDFSVQERSAIVVDGDKFERSKNGSPSYTNLTSIPITRFSCGRRKGTFADVETNCQVFHECSGWSMTSSLCPVGTAYSVTKKRCEWWNTVICDSQ